MNLLKLININAVFCFAALLGSGPIYASDTGHLEVSVYEATGHHDLTSSIISIIRGDKLISEKISAGYLAQALSTGKYDLVVHKGPEYRRIELPFVIKTDQVTALSVNLSRIADMKKKGWWSGDTHIHLKFKDIKDHMDANDVNVAPVFGYWMDRKQLDGENGGVQAVKLSPYRIATWTNWEDESHLDHSAISYFNLLPRTVGNLDLGASSKRHRRTENLLTIKRAQPSAIALTSSVAFRNIPAILATGKLDALDLASHTFSWDMAAGWPAGSVHAMLQDPQDQKWWRTWMPGEYPVSERGKGLYYQDIYYRILNCGFRLPPTGGSAAPVNKITRLGYNRVYVHTGSTLDYDAWWSNLKSGRVFVTNGPLLTVTANDAYPGTIFRIPDSHISLNLHIWTVSNDPIESIEIIKNGKVYYSITPSEADKYEGDARVAFDDSGWFLVRVITHVTKTFRFASSGPFYVEGRSNTRVIDPDSVRFFLKWIQEEKLGRETEDYFKSLLKDAGSNRLHSN